MLEFFHDELVLIGYYKPTKQNDQSQKKDGKNVLTTDLYDLNDFWDWGKNTNSTNLGRIKRNGGGNH